MYYEHASDRLQYEWHETYNVNMINIYITKCVSGLDSFWIAHDCKFKSVFTLHDVIVFFLKPIIIWKYNNDDMEE